MSEKPEFVKAPEGELPICPYCKQEIHEVHYSQRGVINEKLLFWCPKCRCVLGTGAQFNS